MKRLALVVATVSTIFAFGIASASAITRNCGSLDMVNFGMIPYGPYQSGFTRYAMVAVGPNGAASYAHSVGTSIEPINQAWDNYIELAWFPVPGATSYIIYREFASNNPTHLGRIATIHKTTPEPQEYYYPDIFPNDYGSQNEICPQ